MADEFTCDGIFESRISGKRESKAGIFITLEIAADDYSPTLSQLRVGTLLKVGYQEQVDTSVQPIDLKGGDGNRGPAGKNSQEHKTSGAEHTTQPQDVATPGARTRVAFKNLPLSQQCGIRCSDPEFEQFLRERRGPGDRNSMVPDIVRAICGIKSRTELSTNAEAANKWRALEMQFQNFLTDQRYADSTHGERNTK